MRQKLFYPISETKKLLSEDFKKQITHGIDGLIFQPVDDVEYVNKNYLEIILIFTMKGLQRRQV